ncbi:hypothetical protein D3C84_657750 [compost metagenome]
MIAQLAADPLDLTVQAGDLLVQARQFGVLVDQAGHRHQHLHVADQGGGGHRRLFSGLQHADRFQFGQLVQQRRVVGQAAQVFVAGVLQNDVDALGHGDFHLAADLPQAEHQLLDPLDVALGGGIDAALVGHRPGLQHDGVTVDAGLSLDPLPDLFGDKGHERVGQAQRHFQYAHQGAAGAALAFDGRALVPQHRLDQLQVPGAVLVPDEFVERLRGQVEAEGVELAGHFGLGALQGRDDPAVHRG